MGDGWWVGLSEHIGLLIVLLNYSFPSQEEVQQKDDLHRQRVPRPQGGGAAATAIAVPKVRTVEYPMITFPMLACM